MHHTCAQGLPGDKEQQTLELEWQAVVSHCVGSGNQTLVSEPWSHLSSPNNTFSNATFCGVSRNLMGSFLLVELVELFPITYCENS